MRQKLLNIFILLLLGAVLLRMSWQKWVNITLDYGRELYTPWRITCGQVLYKDIASLFGPFPPYWNALLFKAFGVSVMTLALFNVLLVISITALIYRFFSYTTDKQAAFFTSAAFLIIFAFQQNNVNEGNHAYICPYTYSVTYAVFFSWWAIDLFAAHRPKDRDVLWAPLGALIGLTALCRFEIFVSLTLAIASGFILKGIMGHWPFKGFLKAWSLLLVGFCVPVGIAYLYFSAQLPLSQVWPDILGFNYGWLEILKTHYYQFTAGLDHPWHNFMIMLATAACYGFVIVVFKCLCMGAYRLDKSGERWQGVMLILLGLAGTARIAAWILSFHYDDILKNLPLEAMPVYGIFKGLPIVVIFMAGYLSWLLWRYQQDEEKIRRILPLWVLALWSLLMLSKVFLNVRVDSEGFVYALPGVMLFVAFFLDFVPRYFEHVHARGRLAQTLSCLLMALIFITVLKFTALYYQSRNFQVKAGPDTIIADALTHLEIGEIDAFLKNTDKIIGKDTNFVAFPQGVMLNFLTKRTDPLPYIVFQPSELIKFSGQEMLRSFKEHRPDYVILSNSGHEVEEESLRPINAWILANYRLVWPVRPETGNMMTIFKRSE